MRRTIVLLSVFPFVSAFLGGALAFSLVVPQQATAQSSQLEEVRASAFILVGPDGTVLADLRPGPFGGVLQLYDLTGTRRVNINAGGILNVLDQDGILPVFRAGHQFAPGIRGEPPLRGMQLSPDGSISIIPPSP